MTRREKEGGREGGRRVFIVVSIEIRSSLSGRAGPLPTAGSSAGAMSVCVFVCGAVSCGGWVCGGVFFFVFGRVGAGARGYRA